MTDHHPCLRCGKAATMICKGCKGLPNGSGGTIEIIYCRAECQKEDWERHKASCKAARCRKAIYRAGELAKAVSRIFSWNLYSVLIKEVKKYDDVYVIYPPTKNDGKCAFPPFPSALFPNKEEADAILEFQTCNGILDHLHAFLRQLLKEMCSEVDEIMHLTKDTQFRMMLAYNTGQIDATDYAHSVIRATLENGERYVLDLTGAQYGWQEVVTPWDMYEKSKIRAIISTGAFGSTRQFCKERAERSGAHAKWYHDAELDFEVILYDILRSWELKNMSLESLLKLPDDEFNNHQAALVAMLEEGLEKYKQLLTEAGALDLQGEVIVGALDRDFKIVKGEEEN